MQQSARMTIYGVQCFSRLKGGVKIDDPIPASTADLAKRMAERLAGNKIGVVAYSRCYDAENGEIEEPKVLVSYGEVPFDITELM
jgi:hypothetical protein